MKYQLTVFDNLYDRDTSKLIEARDFDEFESMFYRLSKIEGRKLTKDTPRDVKTSPLISPAVYLEEGATRSNENVTYWGGWACLDVDDYTAPLEEVFSGFMRYRHICYSTASSRPDKPKFRVVIPLTRYVDASEIRAFWYAFNRELGEYGDGQTKDLSRMYYVPAQYPEASNFIFTHHNGPDMDPDSVMRLHPIPAGTGMNRLYDLHPDLLKNALSQLKGGLKRDITWTSYRDCPFVSREGVRRYALLTSGWYTGLYKLMISIAMRAVKRGYDLTPYELETLAREIDADNGGWYGSRALQKESVNALEFALTNATR